jgi:hypothetical protein
MKHVKTTIETSSQQKGSMDKNQYKKNKRDSQ